MGTVHYNYLCQTDRHYGKGDTIEDAKAACKAHGGKLTRYVVWELPPESYNAYVDDFGTVRWSMPDDYDGPRNVDLTIVASHGVKAGK